MAGALHRVFVLIVAGGNSRRFGGDIPKPYSSLQGMPLLAHTLGAFLAHTRIAGVQVVIRPADRDRYDAVIPCLLSDSKLLPPVSGGAERQDSVRAGLEALEAHTPAYVLIHDAARPLVSAGLIDRMLAALPNYEGVMPVLPVVDTLRNGEGQDIPRAGLVQVQTPQGFPFEAILAAHKVAAGQNYTDDIAVLRAHHPEAPIGEVPGERCNLKITTEADMNEAHLLLRAQKPMRVAMGYDVHRLTPHPADTAPDKRVVMIGGVAIAHEAQLEGHSDADVVLHALTDALLGVLGEGDIGTHFPPSQAAWRGKDSAHFVIFARDKLAARGGEISHADITILAEAPKIGPHRELMRARIADLLGIMPAQVSVKATTTEGLGFVGRKEGIAAHAVVTVWL